jgi:aminoglycoside phosphotransferase (APT) family kinase protein
VDNPLWPWPGNTLWSRSRLTGIVDWQIAAIGDPRYDVAYCRQDLFLFASDRAARTFTRAYEVAIGRSLTDMWFWDLSASLRPLAEPRAWLSGYEQLGRTDLSLGATVRLLRRFIERALATRHTDIDP